MLVDKHLEYDALLGSEEDRGRLVRLLDNINSLLESNPRGSVCVAVSGDWGSGKTTYLKAIESYYGAYLGNPVLFFEAWKHQDDDNPLVPLLLGIKNMPSLKPDIRGLLDDALKPLVVSTIAAADIILNFFTKKGVKSIEEAFALVEKDALELKSKYNNNMEALRKAIARITEGYEYRTAETDEITKKWSPFGGDIKNPRQKYFVLIIDDLDRLVAEKAFKVIEALRFYFDMDNVLIIMGINDNILDDYVNKHYGVVDGDKPDKDKRRGERFLEKIFHWTYELSYSELNGFHTTSLQKRVDTSKMERIRHVLSAVDSLSHRKWIKLMNRIEKKTAAVTTDDRIEKLVFSAIIKELYPRVEMFSRRFPDVLDWLYNKEISSEPAKKAMEELMKDNSFMDFPEKNYRAVLDKALGKPEKKETV
ncbi:MAG: hypothetical protein EPN22_06065 [Nitrospirae bacterium]|nr:MAG: hypothetical protein EPN22_06065 [Nitrospirota bacterium]